MVEAAVCVSAGLRGTLRSGQVAVNSFISNSSSMVSRFTERTHQLMANHLSHHCLCHVHVRLPSQRHWQQRFCNHNHNSFTQFKVIQKSFTKAHSWGLTKKTCTLLASYLKCETSSSLCLCVTAIMSDSDYCNTNINMS